MLVGQKAMVFGGNGGIGSAIVKMLLSNGVDVAICSRNPSPQSTDTFATILRSRQSQLWHFRCDLNEIASIKKTFTTFIATAGALDIVVHTAGARCSGTVSTLAFEDWKTCFDTQVNASFILSQQALPYLKASDHGSLLFISSAAAYRAPANGVAYSTAKAALNQFVRCMANEVAGDGITVNCVSPGFIDTNFHVQETQDDLENIAQHRIPLRRFGTAEEVAKLVCSTLDNRYITGQSIVVDGGINLNFK